LTAANVKKAANHWHGAKTRR